MSAIEDPSTYPRNLPRVTIVVPTRNEAPNIDPLLERLEAAMDATDITWEAIFVDDSDDATPAVIRAAACRWHEVRLLHREIDDRPGGLGGAVQAAFRIAAGEVLVVMDADLQHPPDLVPTLVRPILAGVADLVVGTRYQPGGTAAGLGGPWRKLVSGGGRLAVHLAVNRSRAITDPLSGLFAVNQAALEGVTLEADGFKILLEVVARSRWRTCINVPYEFGRRHAGQSKAAWREGIRFGRHLSRLIRQPSGAPPATDTCPVWTALPDSQILLDRHSIPAPVTG